MRRSPIANVLKSTGSTGSWVHASLTEVFEEVESRPIGSLLLGHEQLIVTIHRILVLDERLWACVIRNWSTEKFYFILPENVDSECLQFGRRPLLPRLAIIFSDIGVDIIGRARRTRKRFMRWWYGGYHTSETG